MAKVNLRYVQAVRKKGRTYYYYRRPGRPRTALPADPSSPAFAEALGRLNAAPAPKPEPGMPGSFEHLCQLYLASPSYQQLAPKTRVGYRWAIDEMRGRFGDLPTEQLSRGFVFEYRDEMAATPRKANLFIAILRRMLGFAVNHGMLAVNPALKPEQLRIAPRRQVWSAADEARFLEAAPQLRLEFFLGAYTAQREGDVLAMAWSQYNGNAIRLRQRKTGILLEVPCHAALRAALDAAPRRSPLILFSPTGRPWREDHFRHVWRKATLAAGLDGLQYRDLRRTAIVRLAEAGATVPEIAAISGHAIDSCQRILEVYLPRNVAMARAGIVKLENVRGSKL